MTQQACPHRAVGSPERWFVVKTECQLCFSIIFYRYYEIRYNYNQMMPSEFSLHSLLGTSIRPIHYRTTLALGKTSQNSDASPNFSLVIFHSDKATIRVRGESILSYFCTFIIKLTVNGFLN
jgi:hypothetical protein